MPCGDASSGTQPSTSFSSVFAVHNVALAKAEGAARILNLVASFPNPEELTQIACNRRRACMHRTTQMLRRAEASSPRRAFPRSSFPQQPHPFAHPQLVSIQSGRSAPPPRAQPPNRCGPAPTRCPPIRVLLAIRSAAGGRRRRRWRRSCARTTSAAVSQCFAKARVRRSFNNL